jgi:hypothetical protein
MVFRGEPQIDDHAAAASRHDSVQNSLTLRPNALSVTESR